MASYSAASTESRLFLVYLTDDYGFDTSLPAAFAASSSFRGNEPETVGQALLLGCWGVFRAEGDFDR